MIKAFCLTMLIVCSLCVSATELPDWHLGAQSGNKLFKGPFTQQKKTKFLRRPIKSSGTILLSGQHGIAWQTELPVKSTMVITDRFIATIDSQNQRQTLSGGSDLNNVFLNALTGNWQSLEQHFGLTVEQTDGQYCVELSPKTSLTQNTLESIKVCGSKNAIETMHIVEPGSVITDIAMTLTPYAQLTDLELKLFTDE